MAKNREFQGQPTSTGWQYNCQHRRWSKIGDMHSASLLILMRTKDERTCPDYPVPFSTCLSAVPRADCSAGNTMRQSSSFAGEHSYPQQMPGLRLRLHLHHRMIAFSTYSMTQHDVRSLLGSLLGLLKQLQAGLSPDTMQIATNCKKRSFSWPCTE